MSLLKIEKSRRDWKSKAKLRTAKISNLKKTAARREKRAVRNADDKALARRLLQENEELRAALSIRSPSTQAKSTVLSVPSPNTEANSTALSVPSPNTEANSTVLSVPSSNTEANSTAPIPYRVLCILILIRGVIPFRSVPRILKIFQPLLPQQIKIAHFTSVIHWTLRAGVALYNQVAPLAEPWVALIDCSIAIGTRKALVILRVPLRLLHKKDSALGLQDCECIGLEISSQWNGESVNEALERIFTRAGVPAAILKDGGADLKKGVELYSQRHLEKPIQIVEDVGHVAANLLKAHFQKDPRFVRFLKIVTRGASRIRQTDLACLLPPKIRSKSRFQSITVLGNWAQEILKHLGTGGPAESKSDTRKLNKAFGGLQALRPFLLRFGKTCSFTEEFLKLLKNKGLNETTYREALQLLAKSSAPSKIKKGLTTWLDKHLAHFRALKIPDASLPVSSDPIESLFGKFKTIVQRNPHAELNRLIYVIPLLCGQHSPVQIAAALSQCSHKQMQKQVAHTVPTTLRQMRAKILKSPPLPDPKTGDSKSQNTG